MNAIAFVVGARLDLLPFGLGEFPVALQPFLAEWRPVGCGVETTQAERQRGFKTEQAFCQGSGVGFGHGAGFEVQFAEAIDDIADLAVRVIDLLQGIFDFVDCIFGEPDQHGGRIRMQQFGQRIGDLVDIAGIGADLAPVDETANLHRIVDGTPEGFFGIAAAQGSFRLEQKGLVEAVVTLGDIQQ
jgi:hypothetical protein